MKKRKGNKIIITAILSIGIFSILFMTVNNLVFAMEGDKTESIIPVENDEDASTPVESDGDISTSVESDEDISITESYKKQSFTVFLFGGDAPNDNSISYEEAAEIGAEYLLKVFGENIDGKAVEMCYQDDSACAETGELGNWSTRTYWVGRVANSKSLFEKWNNGEVVQKSDCRELVFWVDAVSGEIKAVSIYDWSDYDNPENEVWNDLSVKGKVITKKLSKEIYNENPEKYNDMAKEFAQKILKNTEAVDVVYNEIRSFDCMVLVVTDNIGHELEVVIDSKTKQVISVNNTREDYINPDYENPNAAG